MQRPDVSCFHHTPSGTWSYLVSDPAGVAAIIDPVLDFDGPSGRTGTTSAQQLLAAVRERDLDVRWILETHAHADHLSAGHWLKQHLPGATLAIGEGIRGVQKTFRPVFDLGDDFPVDGSQFDHLFADGETFAIGSLAVRVIAVPGHTVDSVAYLSMEGLLACMNRPANDYCTACWSGQYKVPIDQPQSKFSFERDQMKMF